MTTTADAPPTISGDNNDTSNNKAQSAIEQQEPWWLGWEV